MQRFMSRVSFRLVLTLKATFVTSEQLRLAGSSVRTDDSKKYQSSAEPGLRRNGFGPAGLSAEETSEEPVYGLPQTGWGQTNCLLPPLTQRVDIRVCTCRQPEDMWEG